jgi:hypothetical protein
VPADVASPWGFVFNYGVQLFGGLRRAFHKPQGNLPLPVARGAPKPKPPPPPPPSSYPEVSPYVNKNIDEPKRLSGRKAKKASKPRRALRYFGVWYDSLPGPVRDGIEYAGNNPAGAPGISTAPRVKLPQRSAPRGKQRGYLDTGISQRTRVSPSDPYRPLPMSRPPPRNTAPPSAKPPQAPPQPMRSAPLPKFYETAPTAPEVSTQTKTVSPGGQTNPGRTAPGPATQPVHPGPGRAAPAPSPARMPAPAGPTAPRTGKTGSRSTVARAPVGSVGLFALPLLVDPFGKPKRGFATALKASPSPFPATSPATKPSARTVAQVMTGSTDPCNCPHGKRKKPRGERKPRTECFTGTYTETARGISKKRSTQVPCQ